MATSSAMPPSLRVFRAMKEDQNGQPVIGPTARTLGVRPGVDVVTTSGQVQPGRGGMSVAPVDPQHLPLHRLPPELGGTGKDPVWEIEVSAIGPDLEFAQDTTKHGTIGPVRPMSLDEFQKALADTASQWRKVEENKP